MFTQILASSLTLVRDHPMLVRIAFLTWFVHTLSSFWRFIYTFYVIIEKNVDISSFEGTLSQYIRAFFEFILNNISFGTGLTVTIIGVIWYFLLYPIGHGMMVVYAETQSFAKALKVSLSKYFTITITEWILAVMTVGSWHLLGLRYFYAWGILDNILVQTIVFLVWSFVVLMAFFYAYANISSVVDDFDTRRPVEQAQQALRNSSRVAMEYPFITLKFIFLSIILELRFLVTTIFIVAIPALLVWLLLQFGIIGTGLITPIVITLVIVLLIFAIYINSIIDAFFTVYRYKLYKKLTSSEEIWE